MKYICYYHKNDFDGKCAGATVKLRYPGCKMIGWNYGDPINVDEIDGRTCVYVVDLSFPIGMMMAMERRAYNFTWIDHHATALDAADKAGFDPWGIRQIGIGACELTWKYIFPTLEIPRAVHLLALYDVFRQDENPDVLPFQYGMRAKSDTSPDNDVFWKILFEDFPDVRYEIIHDGQIILDYERIQNRMKCKSLFFETQLLTPNGQTYPVIAANVGLVNSLFFDGFYDLERHDMMVAFVRRDRKWDFSLYSTCSDVHCGKIAEWFGGGGHKGAAGFSVMSDLDVPLKNW